MKKILLSLFSILFCITLSTKAQIPNPGFESWNVHDPTGWVSSNVATAGLINITHTTDHHLGSYAVKGEVVNWSGLEMGPVIQSGPGGHGNPMSQKYLAFELWYKFTGVGGDRFAVNVGFSKAGVPVAQGAVALPATVSTWTHLVVPMNYLIDQDPDTAVIQISISGPTTGVDYHVGSVMFVDDLLYSNSNGVEDNPGSDIAGKCYPNPSPDVINVPVNENVPGEFTILVYNNRGQEVKKMVSASQLPGKNSLKFSIEDLPPGLYFYSITGQNTHYQGKFTVSR